MHWIIKNGTDDPSQTVSLGTDITIYSRCERKRFVIQ